jgi:hypothetical protein
MKTPAPRPDWLAPEGEEQDYGEHGVPFKPLTANVLDEFHRTALEIKSFEDALARRPGKDANRRRKWASLSERRANLVLALLEHGITMHKFSDGLSVRVVDIEKAGKGAPPKDASPFRLEIN